MPARRLIATLVVFVVAALAAPLTASAEEHWTPVVATVVAPPQPVLAADNRVHLAYELLLVNRGFNPPAKLTVERVSALAGGKVVATLGSKALAAVMVPFSTSTPGTKLAAGEAASVMMDVSFARGARIPKRLEHRLTIAVTPRNDVIASSYRTAPTRVSARTAVVVEPPLRGPGWIVGNGCCAQLTSHRGALLPVDGGLHESERFAIDFIQIQPNGLLATGPLEDLSSYPFFGDPIYSVRAGRVVRVVDDLPESPPGELPFATAAAAGGNYVVVDIGGGRFAFYAHLQPGSIRVEVGDQVSAGQVLALLGSSGNSNAPHLHFHVMDGPDPLASNGLPYRFSAFTVAGMLTNFAGLFDNEAAKIEPKYLGAHVAELPLNQQVIGF